MVIFARFYAIIWDMGNDGILWIVSTPIGNLGDITLRALETLRQADAVYAEDTRVSGKLLSHFEIKTPIRRLDAHTEMQSAEKVIERLAAGERVAYISDAGTPGISDPGVRLATRVRAAGFRVETIPGPSALTAALSIAGVPADEFLFLGFLPHKKGRQTAIKEIAASERTVVLYESTHRIMKLLTELSSAVSEKKITVARELTKIHEEVVSGTPSEVIQHFTSTPEKQRGEFVVIVSA